jgi:hypothetical protein
LPLLVLCLHGTEIERPLAVVLIDGLMTSTLFTLFSPPTFYTLIHRWQGRWRGVRMMHPPTCAMNELVSGSFALQRSIYSLDRSTDPVMCGARAPDDRDPTSRAVTLIRAVPSQHHAKS